MWFVLVLGEVCGSCSGLGWFMVVSGEVCSGLGWFAVVWVGLP